MAKRLVAVVVAVLSMTATGCSMFPGFSMCVPGNMNDCSTTARAPYPPPAPYPTPPATWQQPAPPPPAPQPPAGTAQAPAPTAPAIQVSLPCVQLPFMPPCPAPQYLAKR